MPANLTPQYLEAELRFKQARTTSEKITALEAMMAIIPKHKGTEKLRAQLKARMAKLREEQQRRPTLGKSEQLYDVRKEGAGQVVLLGLPNSGKSTLFTRITHADSEVADYPFTTQKPVPGMMRFENLQIQLVDTPPVQLDHSEPGFSNLLHNADGLLPVLDLTEDPLFQMEVLREVLSRMKVDIDGEGSVPGPSGGSVHRRRLLAGNKCDLPHAMDGYRALVDRYENHFTILPISAKEEMNCEELKREIYRFLGIIRVYTKVPGREADLSEPVILRQGSTVGDVAFTIHKDFASHLKYARIWGSGKFGGQMVKRDFQVSEGDVVEFHI